MLSRTVAGLESEVITEPFITTTGLVNCACAASAQTRQHPKIAIKDRVRYRLVFIQRYRVRGTTDRAARPVQFFIFVFFSAYSTIIFTAFSNRLSRASGVL